jgi:trans-2,3-dihydro-3-hydroxyanthranilate isomerase
MRRNFVVLDVFTARRRAGNPLAVVLDSQDLDSAAMQSIAREFNLSETVFVMPPQAGGRAKIRIFTPGRELPFAGHPTVGTAVLLALKDSKGAGRFVLEEEVGPVPCAVEPIDAVWGRARFDLPKLPEPAREMNDPNAVAAAVGLKPDDIGDLPPGIWSAGVLFAYLPVRSRDAVARSKADAAMLERALGPGDPKSIFIFSRETTEAGHHFHARMYAPSFGIPEDPATGSAVAGFAGLIAAHDKLKDGEHEFVIEQGYEMGRPSVIRLYMTMRGGKLSAASIGGEAVIFSEGTFEA